ncbi:MAG: hypothetical protein CML24_02030 [Rhizobiales bacterium]|nr:hypothetical protein [Hyphomicrobiales bacterium]
MPDLVETYRTDGESSGRLFANRLQLLCERAWTTSVLNIDRLASLRISAGRVSGHNEYLTKR